MVIVDVVMETEQAGLELIEFIRKTLNNQSVRIILRTGHPGQAPESQVIFDYDINDYKSKNELTARKLVTSVVASLRAYRTLKNLEVSRRGLEMILDSTDSLFEFSSIKKFSHGVLYQLTSFLSTEPAGILCLQTPPENLESIAQIDESVTLIDELQVIGGLGVLGLEEASKNPKNERLVNDALTLAKRALTEKTSLFERGLSALYVASQKSPPAVAVLCGVPELSDQDRFLLDIYISKISLALANIIHYTHYRQAKDAARTDVLTALPNRRDYVDRGQELFAQHQANSQPMVLAVIDLDNFKPINNRYGHDKGDLLLREFAHFVQLSLKSSDYFARIGGDEFILILPNTDKPTATKILQRLIGQLSEHQFLLKGLDTEISVGASIGADDSLEGSIDDMFKRADSKMYTSKKQGRNSLTF